MKRNVKRTLENILLAVAGSSLALVSRYVCPHEIADLLGSHDARTMAEHFLANFSYCSLASTAATRADTKIGKTISLAFIGGYTFWDPICWETYQAICRGYFQFGQAAAGLLGSGTAVARLECGPLKNFIKYSYDYIRNKIK